MPGQDGRVGTGWVAGVAGTLACVLVSAVAVAALRSDTASADTVLARGSGVVLELADGTRRPAVEGDRVPRGATVLAGRTGAELVTRDRDVHLGGDTEVTVVDGARQVLRSGFVMVDATDAPGLELQTVAGTVTTADDSLVRVDGGALVRVGVLRGDAAAVRAAGRRATADVPTYFQVQVAAGSLPGDTTPFVLTPGDAYERALAADLVAADDDLNALASRLDTDSAAGQVVLTALREEVPEDVGTAGAPGSERALGYLIAAAAPGDAGVFNRYGQVRELRSAGGSWGVVAAIVAAPVGRVGAALAALLDPGTAPVLAGEPLDLGAVLDLDGDGAADGAGPAPQQAPQPVPPGGGGDPEPTAEPDPTPTPTPGDPVTPVVDEVVETVLELISPSPAPSLVQVPLVDTLVSPSPALLEDDLLLD